MVQDVASGKTGTLTFKGILNGSISPQSSQLTAYITPPNIATLHLGQHLYHVSVNTYVPLGLPSDPPASVGANLAVAHNPEPSTLLLVAFGLPGLGLTLWRRRRVEPN
jgi:hypothetical protein